MKAQILPAALVALILAGCGGEKKSEPASSGSRNGTKAASVVKPSGAAAEAVLEKLETAGLEPGVSENGIVVAVADHAFFCKDPASSPQFAMLREHCLDKALEDAKAKIAFTIVSSFSSEEITSEFDGGFMSSKETSLSSRTGDGNEEESIVSMRRSAQLTLGGFRVFDMAESWDPKTGVFEMAAAVVWSRNVQRQSRDEAEGRAEAKKPLSGAELNKWLESVSKDELVGPRTAKDENGVLHYLGIGTADAGDHSEKARMVSELSARKFVMFSRLSRIAVEDTVETDEFSRKFSEAPVSNDGRFMTLGFREAVHPVSGKKLVLSIVEALP